MCSTILHTCPRSPTRQQSWVSERPGLFSSQISLTVQPKWTLRVFIDFSDLPAQVKKRHFASLSVNFTFVRILKMYKPLRWQSQPDAVMLSSVILNSVTEKKQNEVHPGVKSPVLLTLIDTRGEWKIWYYEIGVMKTDSFYFNGLVLK